MHTRRTLMAATGLVTIAAHGREADAADARIVLKPVESMVHVAISERMEGKTVDWLERVSDSQYAEAARP